MDIMNLCSLNVHSSKYFLMPCLVNRINTKRLVGSRSKMCFSTPFHKNLLTCSKIDNQCISKPSDDFDIPVLQGLPDDVAKYCLALVPRSNFPAMGAVCRKWRSYIRSKEFITVRKLAGLLEEWIYVLTSDIEGKRSSWEILDYLGDRQKVLPMFGPENKIGFGVVVTNGKFLVMAGYILIDNIRSVAADVYQYDSCLNSWSKLASMNVARYDFACAEVNGKVYVVGGYGSDGENLSSAEVYDLDSDTWTPIESPRRPRSGSFACNLDGKLYVMGGRSRFTIGNSKLVDVYDPDCDMWHDMKSGCVMVTTHAVVGNRLFCMDWMNERRLTVFDPVDNSWTAVQIPLTGSSSIGFRFGIIDGKLLLFPSEEDSGCCTLLYDPKARPGREWGTSEIRPSGICLCNLTIQA